MQVATNAPSNTSIDIVTKKVARSVRFTQLVTHLPIDMVLHFTFRLKTKTAFAFIKIADVLFILKRQIVNYQIN